MFLLDTSVLSEVLRPRPSPAVIHRLLQYTAEDLFASELTRYELRFGAALRPNLAVFWARLERDVLPLVTWLPVDDAVSLRAGDLAAAQRLAGRPSGTIDPLIAATALARQMPLVTRNVLHFKDIAGLEVHDWFETPAG